MRKTSLLLCGLAVGLTGLSAQARAAEPVLRLSETVEYSSGKYGAASATEVTVASTSAKVTYGDWFVRASIPYLSVDGPADVVFDDQGSVVDTGESGRRHAETGWGDTTLSLGRTFSKIGGSPVYFDLTGRVRLPTGSRGRGLGVGATDYGLVGELGVDRKAGGAYVSAGPRVLGDAPGFDRRDGWQAGAGGWLNVGDKTTVGGGYDWRRASVLGFDDPSEVYAYVSRVVAKGWQAELTGSAGLSAGSPDYSVGLSLLWRAQRRRRH